MLNAIHDKYIMLISASSYILAINELMKQLSTIFTARFVANNLDFVVSDPYKLFGHVTNRLCNSGMYINVTS